MRVIELVDATLVVALILEHPWAKDAATRGSRTLAGLTRDCRIIIE